MPRDRRRRTRRRSAGPFLVASAVTLVVLALAVGAVLSVQNASAPYRRAVNRSFAAQGSVLADQSTAEGRQLRQLMADLPTLKRARLQERLDAMVETTTAQAAAAHDLVPPYPPSGTGPALLSVFDARAAAVADLRSAIDGLLGLEPLPTVGAPASSASTGTDSRGATLLSASRAVGDLEAVGASLERADGTYASVRGVLATAAGNAQMPRSIWVTHHVAWSPAALSTLVGELTTSGSLATNHAARAGHREHFAGCRAAALGARAARWRDHRAPDVDTDRVRGAARLGQRGRARCGGDGLGAQAPLGRRPLPQPAHLARPRHRAGDLVRAASRSRPATTTPWPSG